MKIPIVFCRSHSTILTMNSRAILGTAIAVVFVFAMMTNPVFASQDAKKIASASVAAGTITIVAEGDIGKVIPKSPNIIAAYVVDTNVGLFAITAHFGVDDDDATSDHEWHSHNFTLDAGCIATIGAVGTVTSVSGDTITVTGTGTTVVKGAFFALLKINPVDGSICVLKIF